MLTVSVSICLSVFSCSFYAHAMATCKGNHSLTTRFLEADHMEDCDYLLPIPNMDWMGYALKVAVTFSQTATLYKAQLPNGTHINIYGASNVAYAYILDFKELFNFTIEIIPSTGWIEEGINGTIKGIGYQIATGEADVGLDISKPAVYRLRHLNFLHSIKQDRVGIVFRQPNVQTYRNILFRPFRSSLWMFTFAAWLGLFVSVAVVSRITWTYLEDDNKMNHFSYNYRNTKKYHERNVLLPVMAMVLARSLNINIFLGSGNRNASLKFLLFVSSVFGLTMFAVYSAFIVSKFKRAEPPIKTFQDLVNYDYELMAQKTLPDFTNVYVRDRKVGFYYATKAKRNFISMDDSIKRIFQKNFDTDRVAWFVLESDFAYSALQRGYSPKDICQIANLQPEIQAEHPRLLAMFVGKRNTTLREVLNQRILDILARGLGSRHIKSFERKFQPRCDPSLRSSLSGQKLQEVRFYDVYAAIYILLCGAMIAIVILFGEFIPCFRIQLYLRSRE